MNSEQHYDGLYLRLNGKGRPQAVTQVESNASILRPGRGFMGDFDWTMQLQIGCPAACLFCYVPTNPRLAPSRVRQHWGFEVRSKRDVVRKLCKHLERGDLADQTIYWSGVTDPYVAPPPLTRAVWQLLKEAPAHLRPRRIAVQTRFRPDRDAGIMAEYARSTLPSDGGPALVVSYSVGTDRNDLIRAWERAMPSFESRLQAIALLRAAGIWVVATLSPFGSWHDLGGAAERLRALGTAYVTVLFFKERTGTTTTPKPFLDYLRREYPELLDPGWQVSRLHDLESVFGPDRVLLGKAGFASLASPHTVAAGAGSPATASLVAV